MKEGFLNTKLRINDDKEKSVRRPPLYLSFSSFCSNIWFLVLLINSSPLSLFILFAKASLMVIDEFCHGTRRMHKSVTEK